MALLTEQHRPGHQVGGFWCPSEPGACV